MKKQPVTLAIPKPCHEDWQKMTPAEQGRFCASCQKTVMDFTGKTDREVAKFFEHGSANTCGRFRHDQLQRPLHAVQPTGFGSRLRALGIVVPGLLLSGWVQAQNNRQLMGKVACPRPITANVRPMMGDVAVVPPPPQTIKGDTVVVENMPRTITGKVTDAETGEALFWATVRIKGTNTEANTDFDGNYTLQVPDNIASPVLEFNYTGYRVQESIVAPGQLTLNQTLQGGIDIGLVGAVVIVKKDQTLYNILLHKFRRIRQNLQAKIVERGAERAVAKQEAKSAATVPEPVQPASPTPHEALALEVFPNPFYSSLSLRFNSPVTERLTIRLVDMQGQMLFSHQYEAIKGTQVLTLEPSAINLPNGQYLLEVSNGKALRFAGMVVKGGA